jgi:AcrR family transcriptional regulator
VTLPLNPPAATDDATRSTKERLLDAAESLFARHGFEGTSLRAVTQAADTSLSAANYHFGSKEALVHAALVRRLEPQNRRRLEAIDALEEASSRDLSVEALLAAFLRPSFEAQRESPEDARRLREVAAQLYADPHAVMSELRLELFAPVISRYIDALERLLPDRSREAVTVDFQFFIGVMVHVMSGKTRLTWESAGPPSIPDDQILERMISFATAGLRAGGRSHAPGEGPGGAP